MKSDKVSEAFSKAMSDIFTTMGVIGDETKSVIKSQFKSALSELDFVSKEEYDLLLLRVEKLEKELANSKASPKKAAKKTTKKKAE